MIELPKDKYPSLNFPDCQLNIEHKNNDFYIWDKSRKKWLVLTPEEWVRQHTIYFLNHYHQYPSSMISTESGLKYNQKQKRTDIIIYQNDNPFLLIECKSAEVKLSKSTVEQVAVYNKIIMADYIMITNGLQHIIFKFEGDNYKQIAHLPNYHKA